MAKCRSCGADISEGLEYCEECFSKLNTAEDSESYLDSLLSAVMTDEPERREVVYPKKEASSLVSMSEEPVVEEQTPAEPVFNSEPEADSEPDSVQEKDVWDDFMKDFMTTQETEENPSALFDEPDLNGYNIFGDVDEGTVDRMLAEELDEDEDTQEESLFTFEPEPETEVQEESLFAGESESSYNAFPDLFGGEELSEFGEDEGVEEVPASEFSDVEDLFGILQDERGADAPEEPVLVEGETISAADFDATSDAFSGVVEEDIPATEFGDFADLFDSVDDADAAPVAEDIPATEFGDFSDLFSDLGDAASDMFDFGAAPEVLDESELATTLEGQSAARGGAEGRTSEVVQKQTEKKKPGRFATLFHKLFDDVKVDPSKIKQPPTKEELEAQKKAKQEEKERSKEEKDALLAEKKAQEKQERMEKQRVKNEAKAKKKTKKMEEAKLLLEEIQRTRINRAGASIIFVFFIMIAVLIVVGSNICSYSIGIRNAERQFKKQAYTEAYNEIYGLDVKDEDIVLYDRIMTVMYVQKQLNSYYNYYGMKDYPKALDSLLKGLSRYEKYIELAIELDIDSDLDYVRNKILAEIDIVFGMTEQEAMAIIQMDSRAEYSKRVYDAAEELELE